MPVLTLRETKVLRSGEYPCKVVAVSEVTGQYGDQYKLELELRQRDGSTSSLLTWASQKYTRGAKASKLYQIAAALFNGAPPQALDPMTDFVGKTAIAAVVVETKADGTQVNKIHSFLPLPQRTNTPKPAPAPKPAPPPADEDDDYWQRIYDEGPAGVEDDSN